MDEKFILNNQSSERFDNPIVQNIVRSFYLSFHALNKLDVSNICSEVKNLAIFFEEKQHERELIILEKGLYEKNIKKRMTLAEIQRIMIRYYFNPFVNSTKGFNKSFGRKNVLTLSEITDRHGKSRDLIYKKFILICQKHNVATVFNMPSTAGSEKGFLYDE